MTDDELLELAIEEARHGLAEGGIPIGAILAIDGKVVGRGHNRRIQKHSVVLHAEMDCLENAGRRPAEDYARATLYTTLSPCPMCSGAAVLYKIPRIVVGENRTFVGAEDYLRANGAHVVVVDSRPCVDLMRDFIAAHPRLWAEDIGVPEDAIRPAPKLRR